MKKQHTLSQEILDGFKAVQRSDGLWAIQLAPGRYLHWIELTTDEPTTVSNPDFVMKPWHDQEEAEAVINWLRVRWSK